MTLGLACLLSGSTCVCTTKLNRSRVGGAVSSLQICISELVLVSPPSVAKQKKKRSTGDQIALARHETMTLELEKKNGKEG